MSENLVLRAVDERGYVVLPADYRAALGIEPGDPVNIESASDTMLSVRKSTAGTISVDELGRIRLLEYGFRIGQTLEVSLKDDCMTLLPTLCTCAKCGGTDTLNMVHGEILCAACLRKNG